MEDRERDLHQVCTRVSSEDLEELQRRARRNERSVAAEIRIALNAYLKDAAE